MYVAGIFLASFFNQKAKLWIDGRKNYFEKNGNKAKEIQGCIWFHCASLGEFEMARPLIEKLKKEKPECKILLTFFSPSGYEIRKNYPLADLVIYLPADTKNNAYHFVNTFKPSLAVFVKYEIWLNILSELRKNKIKTILISAVFHEKQRFFKWYGKIFRKALSGMNQIYVQNASSCELLKKWNIKSVVAGDNRYDRVFDFAKKAPEIELIKNWKGKDILIVAGSSWEPEETILASFSDKNPNQKIIFVPHDISDSHLKKIENRLKNPSVRFSQIQNTPKENIILIDNIGMLSSIYRYADFAVIGGGFSGKLHNILEAAAFGIPVLYGPKYHRFQEASEFIQSGAGFEFEDQNSFEKTAMKLLENDHHRKISGQNAAGIVEKNLGATELIWKENF